MEFTQFLRYLLSILELAALVLGLVYLGKGLRIKDNKALRSACYTKAGFALTAYLTLNILRLAAERWL